ncbi:MAG: glycosyltransferase [bacterium]|nr:glycosyltransferase [bacterium]
MEKEKINIIYVHGNSNIISGQEKVLVNIAHGMQKDGHYPTVILPEPGQFADLLKKEGIPVHFLKLARFTRKNPLPYFVTVISLFFYIKKNNIQIVHTSGLFPNQYCSVAAKMAGIPCIIHVHSTIYTRREIKNSFLQLASLTIAISQSIRDRFIQEGADPGKIIVIYNGLGLNDYQLDHKKAIDLKKELGLNDSRKVITQISQIIERKGIQYFIKMAKQLLALRKDVVFLLVGDDKLEPGYMQEMKILAAEHGIQESIKFTGYRKEIPELTFISDVVVLNSFIEGLPLVLMQAMIMDRPIVATQIPGVDELIENGVSGILVTPGDYRAMAEQVNSLLDSPDKVKALTTAGRIKVADLMDLEKQISQIENVYRVYLRQEKTIASHSENGLISVIIPTYNCGKFIAEGLTTIFNQTYKNLEVIIVDDGSTDDTKQVLSPFLEKYSGQIKYVYQANSKCAAARNTGIALARGEYIAFHDADDLCQVERLEKSLEFLRKNNFDWICTGLKKINMNGELLDERLMTKKVYGYNGETGELYDLKKGLFYFSQGLPVHANTLLIKRDCLNKVGLLDESFFICEETDLCIRFQDNGLRGGYLNEMLVTYRSHPASITKSNLLDNLEFVRKLGEKVARKSGLKKPEVRHDYANLLWELSAIYYQSGKWGKTLDLALKSLYLYPQTEKFRKICKYLIKCLKRVMHGKNKDSLL